MHHPAQFSPQHSATAADRQREEGLLHSRRPFHDPVVTLTVSNKKARFVAFCKKAKTKSLFDRPNYISIWVAWLCVMPAILNRLQSSYADCRFEFGVILEWFREHGYRFVFVAGDGLTVGRGNHLMANNINEYLNVDEPPWIIWVHGEHPHFTWHVLHVHQAC